MNPGYFLVGAGGNGELCCSIRQKKHGQIEDDVSKWNHLHGIFVVVGYELIVCDMECLPVQSLARSTTSISMG